MIEGDPRPLPAGRGAAWRVGGVLSSALADLADLRGKGWSLTSRQEIHPDEFEKLGEMLCRPAARAHETHLLGDGAVGVGVGCLRFCEAEDLDVLQVVGGQVSRPT
ncbi:hypothetical protein [Streptomyces vinaceus]|uniref:hypothetical protein n=1 Tax=Streptomyces vinaceus TaxID=1960 RepID=UPI00381A7EA1